MILQAAAAKQGQAAKIAPGTAVPAMMKSSPHHRIPQVTILNYPNCEDCTRLWSAYSKATRDHFELEQQLHRANSSMDHLAVQRILPLVEEAAAAREKLRTQIAAHEDSAHGAADAAKA